MSKLQVKNAIIRSFPALKLEKATFWKCESGSKISRVDIDGGYPDGDELLAVASKESVYLVEDEEVVMIAEYTPNGTLTHAQTSTSDVYPTL